MFYYSRSLFLRKKIEKLHCYVEDTWAVNMQTISYEVHQRKLECLARRRSKEGVSNVFRQPKGACLKEGMICGPEPKPKQMKGSEK